MKTLLAILLALPLSTIAAENQKDFKVVKNKNGTMMITVSKEKVQDCKDKGGCSFVTFEDFDQAIEEVAESMCSKDKKEPI